MFKFTLLCVSIVFVCYSGVHSEDSELKVSPTTFEDLGKPFYEFTCEAYLKKYQWVSWYQEKPVGTIPIFLKTLISHDEGQIKIDLLIPLDESDRESVIYCITHDEYKENGVKTFTKISKSEDIHIKFQKDKYPLKKLETPQVTPAIFNDSGEPIVEFTCWGYLQGRPQRSRLSWYEVKENNKVLFNKTDLQTYYGYEKVLFRKTLEPSDIGSLIYCVHETKDGSYVEGVRSKEIQFTISRDPTDFWGPRIDPVTFSEVGNSLTVNNNCSAYLYEKELLTWFQIKGSNKPKRLTMIQQKEKYGKIEIKLQKTLDLSDKDTEIYCARETVDETMSFNIEGKSRRIRIEFQNHLEALETPYVKVDPSSDFMIVEEGKELDLDCSGSKPVDNRNYRWHMRGPNLDKSTARNTIKYGNKETIHLELYMEQSFHMSRLYCAQEYRLELELPNYKTISYSYGELTRSDSITLLLQGYEGSNDRPMVSFLNSTNRESKTLINMRSIESTCYAFVKPYHVVSWYQTSGTGLQPSSEDTLLKTFQLQKIKNSDGQWMKLNLKKTLINSDNGTKLYCSTQRVLPGGNYKTTKDQPISQLVPLIFKDNITPLETPRVTIEPSSDVIIFDDKQKLELVCGGSEPVDDRKYTWYLQGSDHQSHSFSYNFKKSTSQILRNHLKQTLEKSYHMNKLYCAQDYTFNLKAPTYEYSPHYSNDFTLSYGELARSNTITLLLRTQGDLQEKPEVTPSYLEDQRKSFIVFTCYAFVIPWQVLSWYQYRAPYVTEKILLRTVQLQDITHKNGQWLILTLNKTLQPSDKNSNIYCAKQTVLLGGNYSKESDRMTSQTITLTFQRDISPFNAYVTTRVEPDSDVHFEVSTTKRFTCSGSKRVDGRNYTWFRIDRNFNLTIPKNQSYDSSTNTNVLEVSFDDTFHQNQLFCEQVFLSDIKDKNGTIHLKYYGGIVKSNIITLKRGGKDAEKITLFVSSDRSQKTILLAIIIPVLLAIVAGLAYWNLRRRRPTAVQDVPTATPTPTGTPEPKSVKHPAIAARQYPSEPNGDTMTPTETFNTPKPDVRPKPAPRPDLTLLESTNTSKSEIPLRPTPAAKPAIAARPNLFVSTPNTLAPTETPSPTETPMPTVTPEQPTSVLKEQGDSDAIYGNFVKLFTDMDSNQVTYACLDLKRNKSTAPNVRTQKPPKANIRGAPKTSASADVSRTNASATTTLATSESSPYAQIIGVYTPPNK